MEKTALLGTGLKTAFNAAKKAYSGTKGQPIGRKVNKTANTFVSSVAKTHGYKGNAKGLLNNNGGEVRGLSNFGKHIAGMGVAGATGYAAG